MWIAQDKSGQIDSFEHKPEVESGKWVSTSGCMIIKRRHGLFNNNWRKSLINLETHDYKIEGGILIKVEKQQKRLMGRDLQFKNIYGEWADCDSYYEYRLKTDADKENMEENTKRHKHADLMIALANDKTIEIEFYDDEFEKWVYSGNSPTFYEDIEYRIKPKTKIVQFRMYMMLGQDIPVVTNIDMENDKYFVKWIGDWQEVTIDE